MEEQLMEEIEQNPDAQEHGPTVSEMLTRARESLGLSQKEVADHLYLTHSFIVYIDEGAFEKIPKPAFIKGYLRSYAKVVELNGDEIIARYESVLKAAQTSVEFKNVTEETVGSVNFTGPVLQAGLIGLVAVIVVIALVWWIASSGDGSVSDNAETPVVVSQQQTVPDAYEYTLENEQAAFDFIIQDQVAGEAEVEEVEKGIGNIVPPDIAARGVEDGLLEESDTGDGLENISGAVDEATEPDEELSSGFLTKEVSLVRIRDGDTNYITLDAGGIDEIEITFSNDCWLEIEDGNGDSIYGDLNRSGDVLRVFGIAPFDLLFGRATDVSLTFNGHEIDIGRYTRADETAKVRLANSP
jgi:cytoskeleton protein RodZ